MIGSVQLITTTDRRGAEVFAEQLSEALRERGHDVTVAALAEGAGERSVRSDLVIGSDGSPGAACRIADIADRLRPAIIQANGGSTGKHAALAAWMRPRRRWKLVYRNIGDLRVWLSSPIKRLFYRLVIWPKIDGVVSVSRQARDGVIGVYGDGGPPMEVIYQGVDAARLRPRAGREEVRQRLATADDALVVVWVGALSREKRPDRALRTLAEVRGGKRQTALWMVGSGPSRADLLRMARDLGITDDVRWLGTVDDVGTYLNAADVFLLTSDTEGIPGSLLEAMSVGLPTVTTDVGGISEVVVEGTTGFSVPRVDESALADRLSRLIGDETLRHRLGERGRRVAGERFNLSACVDAYETFYRSIVESESVSGRVADLAAGGRDV